TIVHVKPEMLTEWLDLQKNAVVPALKKAGVKTRTVLLRRCDWRGVQLHVDSANEWICRIRLQRQSSPGVGVSRRRASSREAEALRHQRLQLPEHGAAGYQQSRRRQESSYCGLPSAARHARPNGGIHQSVQVRGASASQEG